MKNRWLKKSFQINLMDVLSEESLLVDKWEKDIKGNNYTFIDKYHLAMMLENSSNLSNNQNYEFNTLIESYLRSLTIKRLIDFKPTHDLQIDVDGITSYVKTRNCKSRMITDATIVGQQLASEGTDEIIMNLKQKAEKTNHMHTPNWMIMNKKTYLEYVTNRKAWVPVKEPMPGPLVHRGYVLDDVDNYEIHTYSLFSDGEILYNNGSSTYKQDYTYRPHSFFQMEPNYLGLRCGKILKENHNYKLFNYA